MGISLRFCLMVMGLLLVAEIPCRAASFVYLSLGGEKKIAIYRLNEQDGALTHVEDVPLAGAPGCLEVDPTKKYLFASVRSAKQFMSFAIDPENGKLKQISAVPAGGNAAYIATDKNGEYLFSAYYGEGKVAVHRLGKDGTISAEIVQTIPTDKNAHAILPDQANQFVFVPHTGPNAIYQFVWDAQNGTLKANDKPMLEAASGLEPRHLAVSKDNRFIYFDNEKGSSVTAYKLDSKSGTLTPFQTVSTLPAGFEGKNTCADIELSPSGKNLYASNRGHNSIACFSVDQKTGRLTTLEQEPTEDTPRSFNIDPTGTYLYAAGQRNGKLAAYQISPQTGKLKRLATYEVGKSPSWVEIVKFP
ncbi:lactonase family protein [Gimesia fumaroli]|uniref:6-phosphogluconolactonase n=1 Tax=Gimesia fumaroli TaxID=2527976 RepID=A0A518IBB1_9PLAN|nr:lactonase family protein [Gimesia fumaroli]QDV50393.1 6-phosphogluconolactonase [Gimesia fumaroli]